MPRRRAQHPHCDSRATLVHLASTVLGVEKLVYLYLPPEYAADATQRFPTLYLLRGHEREWVNPQEDHSRQGLTVIDVYERLRAEGRIGPLILVMPGIASDDNQLSGMLTDFRAPDLAGDAVGIGSGQFERYFVEELIPWIDETYRSVPAARAVAGFSLGGMMAVKAAARYPELFVSVGAYDGTFFFTADGGRNVRASDSVLMHPMFDPAFGLPRDFDFITAQSPANLILHMDPAQLRRITWLIQYGPEQIEPWGSNFYRGEHFLRVLHARGGRNSLPSAVIPDGDHTWRTADRHIEQTLPLHWEALRTAGGL